MKAIQISQYGDADQLKLQEVETPKPQDNEVLVRIFDAGVNPFDWKVRRGHMKEIMPAHFPLTMGYDFAGEVAEIGSQIKNFKPGDRVFGFTQGAYAEFGLCHESKIAKIPDSLSFEVAASLPTPGLTAYQLIVDNVKAAGARRILIHGAAGAVGSLAVQIAKSLGMRIYANAAKSDESYLTGLGAQAVIDFHTQRFEEFCAELDAIVDLVGGDTLDRSYQCVKKGGLVISTVGPIREEMAKRAGVTAKYFQTDQNSDGLRGIAELVASGKIRPRLADVMPLEKAAEAQKLNEMGKSHGKIVLQVH